MNSAVGHKRAGRRHAAGVCCSEKYLDTIKIFETTRDSLNTKLWLAVMLVLALALLWPLEAASLRNCSQPLGMEDGRILDTQISASSSYQETLVGPDKEASTYYLCPLLSLFFHIVGHPKLSVCLAVPAVCNLLKLKGGKMEESSNFSARTNFKLSFTAPDQISN